MTSALMTIFPPPIPPAEMRFPFESETEPPFDPVSLPTPYDDPPLVMVPEDEPPAPPLDVCPAPPPPSPM